MIEQPLKKKTSVELLSPAGDLECAHAAIENGADAIYFGLDCGFNARHRARNFGLSDLSVIGSLLRSRGVRGYVTMNTLVFPDEMAPLVDVVQEITSAGIDAVLVQDFGVARLVRAVCPDLEIHASTQMSLTSAETIKVAEKLGLARVVLARELSVSEIKAIAQSTELPLEVFIHGALCVAYSGQCLTSESLGGRSANRGQCAQACRLPYDLICDGEEHDLEDVRYLLSPQDLAGYAAINDLVEAGVQSLKIEGRLKTPEYVANITTHYRKALDQACDNQKVEVTAEAKREMELSFSRGFSSGWLNGNDHKQLVPGLHSSKRGIELGRIRSVDGQRVQVRLAAPVALGDGLSIACKTTDGKDLQQGGRIYSLHNANGDKTTEVKESEVVWVGFGWGEIDWQTVQPGDRVFKNDDPRLNRRLRKTFTSDDPVRRQPLRMEVQAIAGQPLALTAILKNGLRVELVGEVPLDEARKRPIDMTVLREKLGRLGGTSFELSELKATIKGQPMVPMAMLNQMRRQAVEKLNLLVQAPPQREVVPARGRELLRPIAESESDTEKAVAGDFKSAVLCRDLEQLKVVCDLGVDLVYADFHDIRQYKEAVSICRSNDVPIGLASVRIQKPGEMGLLRVLERHAPDLILARNLAALQHFSECGTETIADFSLNVSNHRSAEWICSLGASRVTASYDLNRDQLIGLIDSVPSAWIETVIHQHMPMFHMEHCVYCSVLSPGTNKTNCGRPCDNHLVALRDRVGAEHTLQADVACRNTLYNATPQSGAELVNDLLQRGVRWYRIELLEEKPDQVQQIVGLYEKLLKQQITGQHVWKELRAANRVGVTRGTLESKRNPLAIL
ncbi:MAG: U32 family peptidase [Rubripirellula sp.]|nr:U32 family peptidase [Rubripirellula sp.]